MSYDYLLKDGDIVVTPEGDLTLATTKLELARQSVLINLTTILTEWFLDQTEGIDWIGILSRRNNKTEVDLAIKGAIKKSTYVTRITYYETEFNKTTNKYSVSFKALIETGEVLTVNNLEI